MLIDYEDEDPEVRRYFIEANRKEGSNATCPPSPTGRTPFSWRCNGARTLPVGQMLRVWSIALRVTLNEVKDLLQHGTPCNERSFGCGLRMTSREWPCS